MTSSTLLTPPATPLRDSMVWSSKEGKPAEHRMQIQLSSLKTRLGLGDWQCGCPTQKGTPYTWQIPEKNHDQIDFHIELVMTLTWASPQLESKLEKLVMLVRCYQHDCGYPKDDRTEACVKVFPDENVDLKRVMRVEKQIKKILGLASVCIGIKMKGADPYENVQSDFQVKYLLERCQS